MDIINVNALPIIPLDERLVVSANVRTVLEDALRKRMQGSPPTCIIGSMSQVNQRIMEVELGSSLMISTLSRNRRKSHRYLAKAQSSGMPECFPQKGKQQIRICSQSCTNTPRLMK
uniref:Family with sequence similarity 227, member A n=1 Tax=Mus musculus TaxID=10090 RepID=A0A087WRJ7_MOUSE